MLDIISPMYHGRHASRDAYSFESIDATSSNYSQNKIQIATTSPPKSSNHKLDPIQFQNSPNIPSLNQINDFHSISPGNVNMNINKNDNSDSPPAINENLKSNFKLVRRAKRAMRAMRASLLEDENLAMMCAKWPQTSTHPLLS